MSAQESSGSTTFDLSEELLQALPSDPFDQLDVARKITSIALSTRVSLLEAESSSLKHQLAEKDQQLADLYAQLDGLEASLTETSDKLVKADQEKESLLKDNASLSNTVRKLQRDVSKLEVFRKKLMQSLQDDEESSAAGRPPIVAKPTPSEDDSALLSRTASVQSQYSGTGNSIGEDRDADGTQSLLVSPLLQNSFTNMLIFTIKVFNAPYTEVLSVSVSVLTDICSRMSVIMNSFPLFFIFTSRIFHGFLGIIVVVASRPSMPHGPLLASQTSTPRLTPPGSPPSISASVSPRRKSKPVSPRRHSVSFSVSRGMFDSDPGSQTGRTRVDGKEFFRQVRSRLSYEQFGSFLTNVKELNSHKQTREETLRKAEEIFGPDNRDLYLIFEGLINRNAH